MDSKSIRQRRQLDKYEPAITACVLTALSLASGGFQDEGVIGPLMRKAFSDSQTAEALVDHLRRWSWDGLHFEAQIPPTPALKEAVRDQIEEHPLAYIREMAAETPGVRFEGATHFDAFIGDHDALTAGGGDWALGMEAKFTSDIASHTTFADHRNQVIRNVEVGNGQFSNFAFLFLAPRCFRERRSRFFVYKMEDYLGDQGADHLRRDALVDPGPEQAADWKSRIGRLDWEDLVEAVFPDGRPRFEHPDADALKAFLRARMLWPW